MKHLAERETKIRIIELDALAAGNGGAGDLGTLLQAFGNAPDDEGATRTSNDGRGSEANAHAR